MAEKKILKRKVVSLNKPISVQPSLSVTKAPEVVAPKTNRFLDIGKKILAASDVVGNIPRTGLVEAFQNLTGKQVFTPEEIKKSYGATLKSVGSGNEDDKVSFVEMVQKSGANRFLYLPAFVADVASDPITWASMGSSALLKTAAQGAKTAKTISGGVKGLEAGEAILNVTKDAKVAENALQAEQAISRLSKVKPITNAARAVDTTAIVGMGTQAVGDFMEGNYGEGLIKAGFAGMGASGLRADNRFAKKVGEYEGYLKEFTPSSKIAPKDEIVKSFDEFTTTPKLKVDEDFNTNKESYEKGISDAMEKRGLGERLKTEIKGITKSFPTLDALYKKAFGTEIIGGTNNVPASIALSLEQLEKDTARFYDEAMALNKQLNELPPNAREYLSNRAGQMKMELPEGAQGRTTEEGLVNRQTYQKNIDEIIKDYTPEQIVKLKNIETEAMRLAKVNAERMGYKSILLPQITKDIDDNSYIANSIVSKMEKNVARKALDKVDEFDPKNYRDTIEALILDNRSIAKQNALSSGMENVIKKIAFILDSKDMIQARKAATDEIKSILKQLDKLKKLKKARSKQITEAKKSLNRWQKKSIIAKLKKTQIAELKAQRDLAIEELKKQAGGEITPTKSQREIKLVKGKSYETGVDGNRTRYSYKDGIIDIVEKPSGSNNSIGIAEMYVKDKEKGTGSEILQAAIKMINKKYPKKSIILNAESPRSANFYLKNGFEFESKVYNDLFEKAIKGGASPPLFPMILKAPDEKLILTKSQNLNNLNIVREEDVITIKGIDDNGELIATTSKAGDNMAGDFTNKELKELGINKNTPTLQIESVEIPINARRQGTGTKMVQQAIDEAKKDGRYLWLHANSYGDDAVANADLVKFYEGLGFKTIKDTGSYPLMGMDLTKKANASLKKNINFIKQEIAKRIKEVKSRTSKDFGELNKVDEKITQDFDTLSIQIDSMGKRLKQLRQVVKANAPRELPKGTSTIPHFKDGWEETWAIPSELKNELVGSYKVADPNSNGLLKQSGSKVMDAINKLFYIKTVILAPAFLTKHFFYSTIRDIIFNKNTLGDVSKKALTRFQDVFMPWGNKPKLGSLTKEDFYLFDEILGNPENIYTDLSDLSKQDSLLSGAWKNALGMIQKQDLAAKVRAFKIAREKGIPTKGADAQLAYDTLYFVGQHLTSDTGSWLKSSKKFAPFLNSILTGFSREIERVIDEPETILKNVGAISALINGLYLGTKYGFDDKDTGIEGKKWSDIFEEEEKRLSENYTSKRQLFFLPILHTIEDKDPQGNVIGTRQAPVMITFPTPESFSYINKINKNIRQKLGVSPVGYKSDRGGLEQGMIEAGALMHPILGTGIGLMTNYNTQTGTDIESMAMEKVEPKARYDKDTSWVSKKIGGALNTEGLSPAKIDYALNQIAITPNMQSVNRFMNLGLVQDVKGLGMTGMPDLTDANLVKEVLKKDKEISTEQFFKKEADVNNILNQLEGDIKNLPDLLKELSRREAKELKNPDWKSYRNSISDAVKEIYGSEQYISNMSARNKAKAEQILNIISTDPVKGKEEWRSASKELKREIYKLNGNKVPIFN